MKIMKIRTLEQLNKVLANDLIWRKKELSEVKSLIETRKFSPEKHNALIRSGICILYANWEGFIKSAADSYVEYVRNQNLFYFELSSNFLALAMKEKLDEAKETKKASLYIPVCDFFLDKLNNKCSLPKNLVSTASNLSSDILKEITHTLDIDFSLYSTKSKIIDEKLLDTRNKIAHGEYLTIDRENYTDLHTNIIEMLETFRNQIENAAINEDFKRIV